jgi:heme-degrading monooxygenase HmoA
MTVLVRYSPTSLTRETYDRVNAALGEPGGPEGPPTELALHVLWGDEPHLRVSELWESEEAWRRFYDGPLSQAFRAAGLEVDEPERVAVHSIWGSAIEQPA